MSNQENGMPEDMQPWRELILPELLSSDTIRELHAAIESEWDSSRRSACQIAAGRALWKHAIHDPLAELFAGETYMRNVYEKIKKDRLNNAREISGVIVAVRTLWFDSKLEAALSSFGGGAAQVVLLGAGMDTRPYRLSCLKESSVFEVDFAEVLQVKTNILEAAANSKDEHQHPIMRANSVRRVAADLTEDDWLEKLQMSEFEPKKNTVWVLEGILYYLSHSDAMKVLKSIADKCNLTHTVLLADFMNKQATTLSNSTFHFYSDWPDQLLPSLGFSDVKLSQIGDPDAHFGLLQDPLNLFNKLRNLPRSIQTHPDDGTPCCRLYLLQASGSPNQTIS
ncbi:Leucine carboxyl methyltransferase [Forsythia ovata]|uniref:Leucine carboxyl methyltransferase n=1 Tax=Forsythia ovata TaxID=205694 RepID=A0ABD1PWN0_9LAMI